MRLTLMIALLSIVACGNPRATSKRLELDGSGSKTVLLAGVTDVSALKREAEALGLKVDGDVILKLEGDVEALNELNLEEQTEAAVDEVVATREAAPAITDGALYLAKKDFGLLEFWQQNPEADGRGVRVGVFDDGISAHQPGFRVTTTGERKIRALLSLSSFTHTTLTTEGDAFTGTVKEDRPSYDQRPDLNGDGKLTDIPVRVRDGVICIDLNLSASFEDGECRKSFKESEEFFRIPNSQQTFIAEFDAATGVLRLQQPERAGDSHGEGVASVIAAHHPGNPSLDGVAPGAELVDIDISEATDKAAENDYTLGSILLGLEKLALEGAEVANISYSLFFSSVRSQEFMAKAIDELVKKYNIVLSFSAGNNGPGLGSLNRRVMYPDSVLVAGAFVSKELDARVWGVSGLPDEGRVVYYSSRGPGPLGEGGPLMIAPLSSLAHADPTSGYSAFSGTSSASPALAGAATVLISAIKQHGLKVDATTVVHALRLSGKRLENEPFVAQGYGLPQVGAALEIYRRLIQGAQFSYLSIRANKGAMDTIPGRGLLFYTSQSGEIESGRVDFTGVLSPIAPLNARTELFVPLKLSYTNGIKGSSELWTSVSSSRLHLEVDLKEVLNGASEGFGEIEVRDARSNELLAIVPVTVIDDRPLEARQRQVLRVSSQGSARMHLNAGLGLFKVRARVLEGESMGVNILIFDADKIRQQQLAITEEIWVPVTRPGHQQVTLIMAGGTGRETVVEIDVEPVSLSLRTLTARAAKPVLTLRHQGLSNTYAKIELLPKSQTLYQVSSSNEGEVKALEAQVIVKEKGTLVARLSPMDLADNRYFYANCSSSVTDAQGKVTLGGATVVASDEAERTVTFRCMPFDHGITGKHGEAWVMNVERVFSPASTRDVALPMRSPNREVEFPAAAAGQYEVWATPMIGAQRVRLGEVTLI